MVRRIHLPVHCAPLERQTLVGHEVYKHLAPLEPEHCLVASKAVPTPLRRGSAARCAEGLRPSVNLK